LAKDGEGEKLERRPGHADNLPSEEDGEKSNQCGNSLEADGAGEKDGEKGAAFGLRQVAGVEEVPTTVRTGKAWRSWRRMGS
jgi:hypothetical protein